MKLLRVDAAMPTGPTVTLLGKAVLQCVSCGPERPKYLFQRREPRRMIRVSSGSPRRASFGPASRMLDRVRRSDVP